MPLKLLIFGDSIQWGQGLLEEDRFSALLADRIESSHGVPVELVERYAHSGAKIGKETDATTSRTYPVGTYEGETPDTTPTIWRQVNSAPPDGVDPEEIDLILLDGGINDTYSGGGEFRSRNNLARTLDPFSSRRRLRDGARDACYRRMKPLLSEVLRKFPKACVVVTGYYPIFSGLSMASYAAWWVAIRTSGITPLNLLLMPILIDRLTRRSNDWFESSSAALSRAVSEVADALDARDRVAVAETGFTDNQCLFAPGSMLWGLGISPHLASFDSFNSAWEWVSEASYTTITASLSPLDPLEGHRKEICPIEGSLGDLLECRYASVGHPNEKGARHYCEAIYEKLVGLGCFRSKVQPSAAKATARVSLIGFGLAARRRRRSTRADLRTLLHFETVRPR